METFCASNVNHNKFRPPPSNGGFYNVPCSRNIRQYGADYGQVNYTRRPLSPWQEAPRPKDRMCPLALTVASLIVLVVVLAVAGLALYMGALHSDFPSPLIAFSCSIKVLRGDRFIGSLEEKAHRYSIQLETLYKRSTLGPAVVSCNVEKFGDDTYTIHFRLTLNRKQLPRNTAAIEKTIKDVITTDAISRKPVFRNLRFVPGSLQVKEVLPNNKKPTPPSELSVKNGVLKAAVRKNSTIPVILPTKKKPEDKKLPVIHGSFKISKTDADITEKLETTTTKNKIKQTTQVTKKSTAKRTTAGTIYKAAAIEKVSKTTQATSTTPKTLSTSTRATTTLRFSTLTTLQGSTETTTRSSFTVSSSIFDAKPWIPIVSRPQEPIHIDLYNERPVYTSFTNPSLSFHSDSAESLGSYLRGHPIPVNKIVDITEPTVSADFRNPDHFSNTKPILTPLQNQRTNYSSFVEVETLKYTPPASFPKSEQKIKNISAIFHNLASSLGIVDLNESSDNIITTAGSTMDSLEGEEDLNFGQGQVEVVDGDEELLIKQTTKLPLVTLLPVKSNSGIGKPLRKLPFRYHLTKNNVSQGERSFNDRSSFLHNITNKSETGSTVQVTEESHEPKVIPEDLRIMGVLNFATENSASKHEESATEVLRKAKMKSPVTESQHSVTDSAKFLSASEVVIYATNSSSTNSRQFLNNLLTPEKLKMLSQISNVHDNNTNFDSDPIISTKAISSSYTLNESGFKVVTKSLNKISPDEKDLGNSFHLATANNDFNNTTNCSDNGVICNDGKCLPENARCNHLKDCSDGKDEMDCKCVDYLRGQFLSRKICDGVVDCWDSSDENDCDWCQPNQYVCANSNKCIDKKKICDGSKDCVQGDDERQCVTVAANSAEAEEFPYHTEGYLIVRQFGEWRKLCVENLSDVTSNSDISWQISDLGKAVCKSMTYQNVTVTKTVLEKDVTENQKYFELAVSDRKRSNNTLSFVESECQKKEVVEVTCKSLQCGLRPQILRQRARIVGGGNAAAGAWPWQAALYKEGEFQCGGTLLSEKWLVSAGHCFYKSQHEYWIARLGALRRGTNLPSPYEQLRSIQQIIIHPGYEDLGFINDISLLELEKPVIFSDYIRPVCLPSPDRPPVDDSECTVLGWGQLSEVGRIFPDTLQEVQVPVISTAECRKRTLFLPLYRITEEMFCAGYERGGRDACLGDSGGPLMCPEVNGRWIVHGITSNGYGCARANRPGVYTKVSSYVDWIQKYMNGTRTEKYPQNRSTCSGYRCPLGQCLPKSQLCNGYMECSDGSDERGC